MMDMLKDKLASRKLWVLVAWLIAYIADQEFAKGIQTVVLTYLGAQGLADSGMLNAVFPAKK